MDIEHHQDPSLPEGHYYHRQIIGLEVVTNRGESLGTVVDILPGRSNDNFIVEGARGQVLIPAIEDVIVSIDLAKKTLTIEAIEGLLNLNENKPPK